MLEALGNLGDFVGGIAVIVTLLYLAIQVRQNSQMLRANALAASSAANISFNHLLGSDPATARVYQLGLESFTSLSEEEQRQFVHLLRGLFTVYQHVFQQYEGGLVDENIWLHDREAARGILGLPHVAVWWERRKTAFTPTFVEAIGGALSSPQRMLPRNLIAEMAASAQPSPLDQRQPSG